MEKISDKLKMTFDKMPDVFTSRQFCEEARKNGVPEQEILKGRCAAYYRNFSELKFENPKRWEKINRTNSAMSSDEPITAAVNLLKKNGYKVMKAKTQWEEV